MHGLDLVASPTLLHVYNDKIPILKMGHLQMLQVLPIVELEIPAKIHQHHEK